MSSTKINDRYPGLRPFKDDESFLFFGRTLEIRELLNMVISENTVILFSKSGIGKSSLLYAGLFPRLKALEYIPIRIRFQLMQTAEEGEKVELENTPLNIVKFCLAKAAEKSSKEILYNKESPLLWEQLKASQFPEKKIPVFVFDQFEEFFNYSTTLQEEFLSQLCELLHFQTPNRILNWIGQVNPKERSKEQMDWVRQPPVKMIFAIRDDKLSELDSLKKFIPFILKTRFRLLPLSRRNAEEAIVSPARLDQVKFGFETPTFDFHPDTLAVIVKKLAGAGNAGEAEPEKAVIDSSQLQKVCGYIEKRVKGLDKDDKKILLDSTIISDKEIQAIIDNFYSEQLATLGNYSEKAKTIIEKNFVIGNSRSFVSLPSMQKLTKECPELVNLMLEARLIKEETIHLGPGYELSHDTLVPAVVKSAEEAEVRQQQLRIEEEKNIAQQRLAEQEERNRIIEERNKIIEESNKEIQERNTQIEQRNKKIEALKAEAETARDLAIQEKEYAQKQEKIANEASQDAEAARKKALKLQAEAEEREKVISVLYKEKQKSWKKSKRNRNIIFALLVIFLGFVISNYLQQKKQKEINTRLLIESYLNSVKEKYWNGDFKNAFMYLLKADSVKKGSVQKTLDSLIFPVIAGNSILYSTDKSLCVAFDKNNRAKVWDLKSKDFKFLMTIDSVREPIFSPNNNYLAFLKPDSILEIWDVIQKRKIEFIRGKEIRNFIKIRTPDFFQWSVQFSPDDRYVTIKDDYESGDVFIVDLSTRKADALVNFIKFNFKDNGKFKSFSFLTPAYFSMEGRFLLGYTADKSLYLCDLRNKTIPFIKKGVINFDFNPKRPLLTSLTDDGGMEILNYLTGQVLMDTILKIKIKISENDYLSHTANGEKMIIYSDLRRITAILDYNKLSIMQFSYDKNINSENTFPSSGISITGISRAGKINYTLYNRLTTDSFTVNLLSEDSYAVLDDEKIFYFVDERYRFHILDLSNFKEIKSFDSVFTEQIKVSPESNKAYFLGKNGVLTQLDLSTGSQTPLSNMKVEISNLVGPLIELGIVNESLSDNPKVLVVPESLNLKGEEKIRMIKMGYHLN